MIMSREIKSELLFLLGGLLLSAASAKADLEVNASVQIHAKAEFEAPLASHGTWVEVGSYGRCWRPARVAVEWRPYCSGEWIWTDCGWYRQSDEPWAWACYHYGWWVCDPAAGWVWVPEVQWAPAWVSWRAGGGYVGWAPLPPPGLVFARHPEPELFVFVGTANFGGPVRPGTWIVRDKVIISHTSEIGGVARESHNLGGATAQKVMVNRGPAPETIQKASGRSFTKVSIQEAVRRTAVRSSSKRPENTLHPTHQINPKEERVDHATDRPENRDRDSAVPGFGGGDRGGHGGRGHGRN